MTRMAGTMSRCDDITDQITSREGSRVNPAEIPCYPLSDCFDGKYLDSETFLLRQKELEAGTGEWLAAGRWQGPYHKAVTQGQDSRD